MPKVMLEDNGPSIACISPVYWVLDWSCKYLLLVADMISNRLV